MQLTLAMIYWTHVALFCCMGYIFIMKNVTKLTCLRGQQLRLFQAVCYPLQAEIKSLAWRYGFIYMDNISISYKYIKITRHLLKSLFNYLKYSNISILNLRLFYISIPISVIYLFFCHYLSICHLFIYLSSIYLSVIYLSI